MAKEMIDYLSDEDDDLMIVDGDFVRGEATYLHQRSLLLDGKGDYPENPTICVDIDSYTDDDDKTDVKREIVKEFQRDGMTVRDLTPNPDSLSDNTVNVFLNAYYQ